MAHNQICRGKDLMLFVSEIEGDKSIAWATNHTLSLTANVSDVSTKDNGIWSSSLVTGYSWEISSENLFSEDGYASLYNKMIAGKPIDVKFGLKAQTNDKVVANGDTPDGDIEYFTPKTQGYYSGKVIITSLQANAAVGDNATMSVTLTGVGKLDFEWYDDDNA